MWLNVITFVLIQATGKLKLTTCRKKSKFLTNANVVCSVFVVVRLNVGFSCSDIYFCPCGSFIGIYVIQSLLLGCVCRTVVQEVVNWREDRVTKA